MTDSDINRERIVLSLLHSCIYACSRFLLLLLKKVICLVLSITLVSGEEDNSCLTW